MDKAALRRQMKAGLAALPPRVRALEEDLVSAAVQAEPAWQAAGTVLVYRNTGTEFGVVGAVNEAFRAGRRVCFPRVEGDRLVLHVVPGWHGLAPGAFGVPEPDARYPAIEPDEVDVALVPGLAFDAAGGRLGRGGGFYDRLIPHLQAAWGVAFRCQLVPAVPQEAHDAHVHRVLTAGFPDGT